MAASYTVTIACANCGQSNTITNTKEAALGSNDARKKNKRPKCSRCGSLFNGKLTSIVVAHSGNVGSNTTITHTIVNGAITSGVS